MTFLFVSRACSSLHSISVLTGLDKSRKNSSQPEISKVTLESTLSPSKQQSGACQLKYSIIASLNWYEAVRNLLLSGLLNWVDLVSTIMFGSFSIASDTVMDLLIPFSLASGDTETILTFWTLKGKCVKVFIRNSFQVKAMTLYATYLSELGRIESIQGAPIVYWYSGSFW